MLVCRKYFSSISMVTPEISGLVPAGFTPPEKDVRIYGRPRNNETLTVLEQHGIRYVMGDNSRFVSGSVLAYCQRAILHVQGCLA
jgi:hypothetical protein